MEVGLRDDDEVFLDGHQHHNDLAGTMSGPPVSPNDASLGTGDTSTSQPKTSNNVITFAESLYSPRLTPVAEYTTSSMKLVTWLITGDVRISSATLFAYTGSPFRISSSTFDPEAQSSTYAIPVNSSTTDMLLYVELDWGTGAGASGGKSTSGLFGIYSTPAKEAQLQSTIDSLASNVDLLNGTESNPSGNTGNGGPAFTMTASQSLSTTTASSISSGATVDASNPAATISSSGAGGSSAPHGGLSTGATAGIAVACAVLGLALIGFLLWFFCLRRRRSRAAEHDHVRDAPYAPAPDGSLAMPHHGIGAPHGDYMLDKEAHAAAADSPHSPYSDDGAGAAAAALVRGPPLHPQQQHMAAPPTGYFHPEAAPAPLPHEDPHVGYQTYSDADARSAGGARSATPQHVAGAVSHTVAHLVEDGMTAEQIRRLEEEERALDEAIARSGRR